MDEMAKVGNTKMRVMPVDAVRNDAEVAKTLKHPTQRRWIRRRWMGMSGLGLEGIVDVEMVAVEEGMANSDGPFETTRSFCRSSPPIRLSYPESPFLPLGIR